MKNVRVILRPFKVDEAREALSEAGVTGITYSEVKGFGRQLAHTELNRGAERTTDYVPKIALEMTVPDALVNRVLEALEGTLRTGRAGDGKIFVSEVEDVVRIRTGERGFVAV